MNAGAGLLGEAELHGLVDGHLEADRRADVLRKLAASPADRALVEGWQDQNDLIRAAFRDVEREALPVALDLAPARLRCMEGGDGTFAQPLAPMRAPLRETPAAARRSSAIATAAAVLVVTLGMAGAWLLIGQGARDNEARNVPLAPSAKLEATLADRTTTALEAGARPAAGLAHVPDLTADGLRLTGVSTQPGEPGSLVLHYRDAGDGRVALGLAGAPDMAPTPTSSLGRTLAWRRGGTAYALAGTLPAERLRRLARSLQDETGQD